MGWYAYASKDILIKDLKEYENNPRNNENAVEAVAESIKQFGFKVPVIIDDNYIIVAGHTRVKAAELLGLETVPCIIADDLTPEQLKAFRLADNKTAELAEWDFEALEKELEELTEFDMSLFGFEETETEDLQEEKEEKPQVEFTEILEENHNYIVLFFDNDIDWLQAQSVFEIKTVKNYSTKKDGKGQELKGIGRVLNGANALSKIVKWGVIDEHIN